MIAVLEVLLEKQGEEVDVPCSCVPLVVLWFRGRETVSVVLERVEKTQVIAAVAMTSSLDVAAVVAFAGVRAVVGLR